MEFRRKLGLRNDRAYVEGLVRAHDYTATTPKFLVAATPEEEAELALRDRLGDEVGALDDELRATRGDDYGGGYVDPSTGQVVIWSVGNRISRQDVEGKVSRPDRLVVRNARFSVAQLDAATKTVAPMFEQLNAEGHPISAAGPDLFTNQLELTVESKADREGLLRRLTPVIDPGMISFRTGKATPTHDIYGGTPWDPQNLPNGTKGFDAYQAGSWLIYAITAGHIPLNTLSTTGHSLNLASRIFWNGASTDMSAYGTTWDHNSGYVIHGLAGYLIGVSGWDHLNDWDNDREGQPICMSGHVPQTRTCGTITKKNIAVYYPNVPFFGNVWLYYMREANYACRNRDSGGPVFGYEWPTARAVGIQSGTNQDTPGSEFGVSSYICYYGHLDHAMYPWGLTDVIKYWDS